MQSNPLDSFKKLSPIVKIVLAVVVSFVVVCCCMFFAIANGSDDEQLTAQVPTLDANALMTQVYKTTVASIMTTMTAQSQLAQATEVYQSPTPEPSQTPFVFFTPTMGSVGTGGQVIAPPDSCIRVQEPQYAKVVSVVDGDTIRVIVDGVEKPVRYIGIDTPESTTQVEYFGEEASEKNKELVAGQDIIMYRDVSETDKFDRLLRYIFVGDKFINYELVNQGYAASFRYDPDTSCANLFDQAENNAKSSGLGLWAATATQAALSTQSPSGGSLEIVAVNKQAEYVDIKNGSSASVDLTGWILVSEKGSQTCALGGTIQPGQTLRVWAGSGEGFSCGFGKPIWNNSEPDPAVLYNPQHAEISRYP
jgi:micrococcal nuclease